MVALVASKHGVWMGLGGVRWWEEGGHSYIPELVLMEREWLHVSVILFLVESPDSEFASVDFEGFILGE